MATAMTMRCIFRHQSSLLSQCARVRTDGTGRIVRGLCNTSPANNHSNIINKADANINNNVVTGSDVKVDEHAHVRWVDMWNAGIAPGELFDVASTSPLLLDLIKKDMVPKGRALVPGCGRGYDVTSLATSDRYVLGLDISEVAVAAAKERLQSLSAEECKCKENAEFNTTSFFDLDTSSEDNKFDFIYDYTFLCALDPSVRPAWAKKMSELVKKDGELLTLVFPIRPLDDKGPPFAVSLDLYRELLLPVGFQCEQLELLPPELCHKGRDGSAVEAGKGLRRFMGFSAVGRWKKR